MLAAWNQWRAWAAEMRTALCSHYRLPNSQSLVADCTLQPLQTPQQPISGGGLHSAATTDSPTGNLWWRTALCSHYRLPNRQSLVADCTLQPLQTPQQAISGGGLHSAATTDS